jgi:serine/threonine-protein kinase
MAIVTGQRRADDEATAGSDPAPSSEAPDESAADSLLRQAARAPGLTPAESGADFASRLRTVTLAPGTMIAGRFRLERRLGEGGMGVVWSAVHAVTRKPVALKFLARAGRDGSQAVARFFREARAASAARHPCVVEVHDVLELGDGSPVMVMELLTGETLAARLAREHTMPLGDIARLMVHVCSAVGCAHALGIVHRDLKPENIFLVAAPGGAAVKVLDFGIAKLTASEGAAANSAAITGTGAILGTPYYMAPEQLFGERDIDHRADIWALGIILYEAASGQRPTQGQNVGQIYKVVMTEAIVPLRERAPRLPEPFLALVDRMLSRDRARRPADVNEVLAVLGRYTSEPYVLVSGAPAVAPGETSGRVDSDTARASTLDAARHATPATPTAARGARGRRAGLWAGAATALVALAGIGASRLPKPRAPSLDAVAAPTKTTPVAPATRGVEPAPAQPALGVAATALAVTVTPSPEAAPRVVSAPTPAATTAPPTLKVHEPPRIRPGPPVATPARPAAIAAATSPPPAPSVDPGSYQ